MFDRVVLGLDPGLTRCGWGVVAVVGPRMKHVAHGTIRTPRDAPTGDRLAIVADTVAEVIATHRPSQCALEQVLFNGNARTAMATGQAAGVVMLTASRAAVAVTSYSPSQVKSAVTGYGAADKAQMRSTVARVLGLDALPQTDAADALALAMCHATTDRHSAAVDAASAAAPAARTRARLDAAIAAATKRDAG
ncbi:MAG: crossover junction endodeoxyribonuclease RuvC [Acidimicrobiia bacterium]|nr:crossover junction endodeoxyribonuclease RuvC [Acidimicrobiia bacterium]